MGEFTSKGMIGLGLLLTWAYLIIFVDWLSTKLKKGLPRGCYDAGVWFSVAVISWLMCYGAGSLFFDIFFR